MHLKQVARFLQRIKQLGGRCSAVTVWDPDVFSKTPRPFQLTTTCYVFLDDPGKKHCKAYTKHLARQLVDAYDAAPEGPRPTAVIQIDHVRRRATIDTDAHAIVHHAFRTAFQNHYVCIEGDDDDADD